MKPSSRRGPCSATKHTNKWSVPHTRSKAGDASRRPAQPARPDERRSLDSAALPARSAPCRQRTTEQWITVMLLRTGHPNPVHRAVHGHLLDLPSQAAVCSHGAPMSAHRYPALPAAAHPATLRLCVLPCTPVSPPTVMPHAIAPGGLPPARLRVLCRRQRRPLISHDPRSLISPCPSQSTASLPPRPASPSVAAPRSPTPQSCRPGAPPPRPPLTGRQRRCPSPTPCLAPAKQ